MHELAAVLEADDAAVVHILDAVFPEFRDLAPESSRNTLRSHMTSGWFLTLSSIWDRQRLPLRLFSVDRCFRREQEEGPTRLMAYHSASCVVAGEDVTLEEGKAVSEALLSAFGFTEFRFQPDEKRSKCSHAWNADGGLYAIPRSVGGGRYVWPLLPVGACRYGIGVPVMNLGLGVERLAMIVYQSNDIRQRDLPAVLPAGGLRPRDRRCNPSP